MPLVGLVDQFPRSSTAMATVPAVLPLDLQEKLGIHQLNSFHIAATTQSVKHNAVDAANPHLAFQPIAAIRVEPCVIPIRSQNANPIEVNGTLNRCGFWLTVIRSPTGTVPSIDYEVRATVGLCIPEIVATGTIKIPTIGQVGLICQVSGVLCTQFELWANVADDVGAIEMGVDIVADRFHGQRFEVLKGQIST